ncbi:GcrA family cell cycle regulator [Sphingomonas sp. BK580]|uniref:GcrA family cell cycle regulator n=1 Tax=Sphingomonas sp. BK580 TaxID=2586972 RepID=UPI0021A70672|nr:GcrA family cell cycle regulator [Sphingomonas sp. BK580]
MKRAGYTWTQDADAQLVALKARGLSAGAMSEQLGASRNAVLGRLHRLRAAGDPRVPAAEPSPIGGKLPSASAPATLGDRLADLVADEDLSIEDAAARLGISKREALALWQTIVDRRGEQAA